MTDKKTWNEFRNSGLLWWINMILHTFGWAIVLDIDKENNIKEVYPARVKFRGFNEETNTKGYINVSKFLKDNSIELYEESKE